MYSYFPKTLQIQLPATTREVLPKFEIFNDRIEITSAGSLPDGLSESEFFEGYSVPRNKELMRVFKDLDLVEQLGSGIPRILESYGKECFHFSNNFLRMTFPSVVPVQQAEHVTEHVTLLLSIMDKEYSRNELMEKLDLTHREHFRSAYLQPAIEQGYIQMTIPDKPKSVHQKYRLTPQGKSKRDEKIY